MHYPRTSRTFVRVACLLLLLVGFGPVVGIIANEPSLARASTAKTPGTKLWEFESSSPIESSPVIGADGTVYVGLMYFRFLALDGATGQKRWESLLDGYVYYSSPAIGADGTVYIGTYGGTSGDYKVYALDGVTGRQRWTFQPGWHVFSSPAIGADGTVYVGSEDNNVYALDGATGQKRWEFATDGSVSSSPAIGADGTVYISSHDGNIYALNGVTGQKRWAFSSIVAHAGGDFSPAIGADGTVYAGSEDGKVYALNGTTGQKLWETDTGGWVGSSSAIGADGTVYVCSMAQDGKILALNGATGQKRWEFITGVQMGSSPAIGADGTVYVGSGDGKVYALNGATGQKSWVFQTGLRVYSSPAIGADGTVYVGSEDSKIYAIQGSVGLGDSPWPMFQQNPQHTGRARSVPVVGPEFGSGSADGENMPFWHGKPGITRVYRGQGSFAGLSYSYVMSEETVLGVKCLKVQRTAVSSDNPPVDKPDSAAWVAKDTQGSLWVFKFVSGTNVLFAAANLGQVQPLASVGTIAPLGQLITGQYHVGLQVRGSGFTATIISTNASLPTQFVDRSNEFVKVEIANDDGSHAWQYFHPELSLALDLWDESGDPNGRGFVLSQAAGAIRTLPPCYTNGVAIIVSVAVNPPSGTQYYAVEETPPMGWGVSSISTGGSLENGVVIWAFGNGQARVLTYRLTPLAGGTSGVSFAGQVQFGEGLVGATGGATSLAACAQPGDGRLQLSMVTMLGKLYPKLLINGQSNGSYIIQIRPVVRGPIAWTNAATVKLTNMTGTWLDTTGIREPMKYYRTERAP